MGAERKLLKWKPVFQKFYSKKTVNKAEQISEREKNVCIEKDKQWKAPILCCCTIKIQTVSLCMHNTQKPNNDIFCAILWQYRSSLRLLSLFSSFIFLLIVQVFFETCAPFDFHCKSCGCALHLGDPHLVLCRRSPPFFCSKSDIAYGDSSEYQNNILTKKTAKRRKEMH